MKPTNGLYFFVMSIGEYSDYRVNGLWASTEPVTKAQWDEFMASEVELRNAKRAEIITLQYTFQHLDMVGYDAYHAQYNEFQAWQGARGSIESMFAAKHILRDASTKSSTLIIEFPEPLSVLPGKEPHKSGSNR